MSTMRYASLLSALWLAATHPVTANEAKPCHPESILAELDRTNPEETAKILRDAAAVKNSNAMLWRIERDGIPTSHLFGTLHIADHSLSSLSPQTLAAVRASRMIALETAQVPSNMMPSIMAQAGPLMAARDQPLLRLLDEDELKIVERYLVATGYPSELALGIRPWVATLFVTGAPCQAADAKPLDLLVAEQAQAAGLDVIGLESPLEQFRSLAAIDDAVQAGWLRASIATHDRVDDIAHTMAELYRFRRIDAVWQLTRAMAPGAKLTDSDLAAIRGGLVSQRNGRLLERSLPLIERGGAFIAVGALHLSADDGLVEALRHRGYTMKPIE